MDKHLTKHRTDPTIKAAIIAGSNAWLDGCPNTHQYDPQHNIGWEEFHYGFIAAEWQHKQEEYYRYETFDRNYNREDRDTVDATANKTEEQNDDKHQEYICIDVKDKKKEKHKVNTGAIWSLKLIEFL